MANGDDGPDVEGEDGDQADATPPGSARADAIEASERRLRTIIDTIPATVFCSLADGSDHFWNQRWRDYSGVSNEQARAGGWEAVIHPDQVQAVAEAWARSMETGNPGEIEVRLRRFDGEYRWFLSRWEPLRDPGGRIVSWYGANTDIHERRAAEEALERSRNDLAHISRVASLGSLTASVAHEVNQPLAAILTSAWTGLQMLASTPPDLDGVRRALERVRRDGDRAADVVRRLRTLFNDADAPSEAVDLNVAALEVIALLRAEFARRDVVVRTQAPSGLPAIVGDRIQLQQVIFNLLLNALEATAGVVDRPREVVLSGECREPDLVRFAVRDNGTGLPAEAAEQLFQPFFTTKRAGLGLGLSISRSIAERHGGRLWAEPNGGCGAAFFLELPIGRDVSAAPVSASASPDRDASDR